MSVLTKAAQAIEELGASPGPTRLTTICEALDLPKSSVHRILNELVELGLVNRYPDGGYAIGHRLLRWGQYAEAHVGLRGLATPILRELRDATGQSVILAVPSGPLRTVVATEQGRTMRPVMLPVGHQAILGAGASGKVLYAYASEQTREEVAQLVADPQTLPSQEVIDSIKNHGWATSFGEMEEDLAGVAVPIMVGTECMGALVVAGSSAALAPERLDDIIESMRHASSRIACEAMGAQL